ncbi:MAG: hypothetical protein GQ564_12885 [Bacteroidales bacterium]|nr:hypothetical protein [Bacteroidales bacterium]
MLWFVLILQLSFFSIEMPSNERKKCITFVLMACRKLTYQNLETPLKVVYKKPIENEKGVQRFVSVDPLASKFPFYTPYQYTGNNPITFTDLDGKETIDNDTTGVKTNGQQNSMSHSTYTENKDENGNISSRTSEKTSLNQNEDGTFTLSHEKSLQLFDTEGNVGDFYMKSYSETVDSYAQLSDEGRGITDNLMSNTGLEVPSKSISENNFPISIENTDIELASPQVSDPLSDGINIAGIASDAAEYNSNATWGKYKNSKGKISKIESLKQSKGIKYGKQGNIKDWGATKKLSKHASKAIRRAKIFRSAGRALGYLSIAYDVINVIRNRGKGAGKAAVNIGFTALAIWGGPVGAAISGVYYAVDIFYPGGWKGLFHNFVDNIMKTHNLHTKDGVMTAPWLYGK